jgi:hypothetical protein
VEEDAFGMNLSLPPLGKGSGTVRSGYGGDSDLDQRERGDGVQVYSGDSLLGSERRSELKKYDTGVAPNGGRERRWRRDEEDDGLPSASLKKGFAPRLLFEGMLDSDGEGDQEGDGEGECEDEDDGPVSRQRASGSERGTRHRDADREGVEEDADADAEGEVDEEMSQAPEQAGRLGSRGDTTRVLSASDGEGANSGSSEQRDEDVRMDGSGM